VSTQLQVTTTMIVDEVEVVMMMMNMHHLFLKLEPTALWVPVLWWVDLPTFGPEKSVDFL
jgi:hypothetical protein